MEGLYRGSFLESGYCGSQRRRRENCGLNHIVVTDLLLSVTAFHDWPKFPFNNHMANVAKYVISFLT